MAYKYYKRKAGGVRRKYAPKKSMASRMYSGAMKGLSLAKLAGQTARIMKDLNTEKKEVTNTSAAQVAHSNLATGVSITPSLSQGVGQTARIGNAIKLVGMRFDIQVSSQDATETYPIRYKYYIVRRNFARVAITGTTLVDNVLDPNPFTGNIDLHALRDRDHLKEFTVMKVGYGKIAADNLTNTASVRPNDISHRTHYFKLNQKLIYDTDGATQPSNVTYHLIMTTDKGTVSASDGIQFQWATRYTFVDN